MTKPNQHKDEISVCEHKTAKPISGRNHVHSGDSVVMVMADVISGPHSF